MSRVGAKSIRMRWARLAGWALVIGWSVFLAATGLTGILYKAFG